MPTSFVCGHVPIFVAILVNKAPLVVELDLGEAVLEGLYIVILQRNHYFPPIVN